MTSVTLISDLDLEYLSMEYKWLIVVLVVLSLAGSISWVLPTPVQRAQARIRKLAMQQGVQVRISKLQGPREAGEIAPESHLATGYGLARSSAASKGMAKSHHWEIFRARGLNTQGLPAGWCWNRGADALSATQLQVLTQLINRLPEDVYALGSSPINVTIYWHEKGTPEELDELVAVLNGLLDQSL
ncbi:MAG: hypothetical protein QGG88_08340 [Gammaproteobacteria bacterium]|nr:hypothetical protein [Gammaproteobacteria bacterium]